MLLASGNTVVHVTTELYHISLDAVNLDNQMVLHDQEGVSTLVGINNLTLSKDVAWNTLCLPFDVPNLSGTYLEGATLRVLDTITFENRVIVYHFKDTTAINADKPYLVKVSENVNNPYFYPVTIKRSLPPGMKIRFDENQYKGFSILGNYNYMTADDLNKDINDYTALYLDGTSLRVVDSTTTLPGFNVFFEILEMPLSDAEAVVLDIEGYNNIFIDLDDLTSDNLFYKDGDWNNPENWAIETLPDGSQKVHIEGQAVIPSNYIAEANEIVIDNGSITIKDGGQLIHNNEGVVATVEKNISGYTQAQSQDETKANGWYFIASPMTSLEVSSANIVSNNYDLYAFDQAQELEWVNYKNDHTENPDLNFTTLDNGKGYLYANNTTFEAEFTGTLANPASGQISLDYSEANSNPNMHGWNLVGNPYPCNAYSSKPYYKMNESGTGVLATQQETTEPIPPCTGILVKANGINDNVVFTKEPQTSGTKGILDITLGKTGTRGNTVMDNAIISFKEGSELGKFYFSSQNANIYIPQDGEDYAIINAEKQGEMPLNFVAKENGTYTISVNPDGVEMNYLHLIDNMTGTDVDLLASPTYTFSSKTTDYASRFKLVFSTNGEDGPSTGSGTFAFIDASGNIIVNGEGVLQVVDVMGHVVIQGDAMNRVSTSGMTPGVYVLRLINDNDVKTQKIIIE